MAETITCPWCSGEMAEVILQSQAFIVVLPADFLDKMRECEAERMEGRWRHVEVTELAILPKEHASWQHPFYAKAYWCGECRSVVFSDERIVPPWDIPASLGGVPRDQSGDTDDRGSGGNSTGGR